MTSLIRLSTDLTLPADAVTQRQAFLGKPGSGKSYAATKEAELMFDIGAQFIALDPVGIWYGLRLDGKGKGLPIPVFGGLHGDIPLEPTSGGMIADLIVDRRLTCVLDVSQFEHDTDKARFASGFAARFFFRMKAAPAAVHIFYEECQEFMPQNPQRGEEKMLHDFTRMDKLGRNFGIGRSLISQRPQEVNKKVLNLTECLFAFQMTGSHERKAIKDWVQTVGADEKILSLLPTLPVAHAHVYSPQWLRVSKTVKIGEKRTADVSSTPAVGVSAVHSKPLAKIDLELIRTQMSATIETAKANDPKELQKTIVDLRRQLAAKTSAAPAAKIDVRAQIDAGVENAIAGFKKEEERRMRVTATEARKTASLMDGAGARLRDVADQLEKALPAMTVPIRADRREPDISSIRRPAEIRREIAVVEKRERVQRDGVAMNKGSQRILDALAEMESIGITTTSRTQLGMMAGYNLNGGTGGQNVADLIAAGHVESPGPGAMRLTRSGRSLASAVNVPTSLRELHDRVLAKMSAGQQRIAKHLIQIYPESISRADLGRAIEYNMNGGTGGQNVADIIAMGAVTSPSPGMIRASDLLFPDGLQ